MVGNNIRNYIQYFFSLGVVFSMCNFVKCSCLVCIVVILCVFVVLCVRCSFTLDAGLLARS